MSFTIPLTGNTIVITAAVATKCSVSVDCTDSAIPTCSGDVCVAMSCGGGSFTPDGAYDSLWDSISGRVATDSKGFIAGIWRTTWNGGHWQLTMTTALCLTALKSAVPASEPTLHHCASLWEASGDTSRISWMTSTSTSIPCASMAAFARLFLKDFHVYAKEDDASELSVPPHVDNGAFLLLTKALDVPRTERSRFVLEDARGEMISPELSDDSALLLMGDSMRHFLGADAQVLRHVMKKVGSGMRAWHGLMYLFPHEMHNDNGQIAASVFLESRSGEQREGDACGLCSHIPDGDRPVCAPVRHSSGDSVHRRSHDHQEEEGCVLLRAFTDVLMTTGTYHSYLDLQLERRPSVTATCPARFL